jgi:hypothetical protein
MRSEAWWIQPSAAVGSTDSHSVKRSDLPNDRKSGLSGSNASTHSDPLMTWSVAGIGASPDAGCLRGPLALVVEQAAVIETLCRDSGGVDDLGARARRRREPKPPLAGRSKAKDNADTADREAPSGRPGLRGPARVHGPHDERPHGLVARTWCGSVTSGTGRRSRSARSGAWRSWSRTTSVISHELVLREAIRDAPTGMSPALT